jgi:hypothetical protein
MTFKFLRSGVLLLAMALPLATHAKSYDNNFRTCPPGTHSETFPNGNGYWCVPNHW